MFLFHRLLLAHLFADFPFQTKRVFERKVRGNFGIFIHSAIFAFTSAVLCFPYLSSIEMWGAVLYCGLTHYIIDKLKIVLFFRYQIDNLFIFLLDQLLHILVILSISHLDIFNLGQIKINYNILPWDVLNKAYNSNEFIYCVSIFTIATYGGNILGPYLKKIFFQDKDVSFSVGYVYYNMAERAVVTFLTVLKSSYYLLVIPFLFILRIFQKEGSPKKDFLTNVLIALVLGIILKIALI